MRIFCVCVRVCVCVRACACVRVCVWMSLAYKNVGATQTRIHIYLCHTSGILCRTNFYHAESRQKMLRKIKRHAVDKTRWNKKFLRVIHTKRFGAAVARWAHNPKVRGSKPRIAMKYFFVPYVIYDCLAQLGDCVCVVLCAVGSIPTWDTTQIFFCSVYAAENKKTAVHATFVDDTRSGYHNTVYDSLIFLAQPNILCWETRGEM